MIDRRSWDVPKVFQFLQAQGAIDPEEMDRVFNMGVGYCLIVRPTFAAGVKRRLEKMGETVYELGTITKGKGRVKMKGRG